MEIWYVWDYIPGYGAMEAVVMFHKASTGKESMWGGIDADKDEDEFETGALLGI